MPRKITHLPLVAITFCCAVSPVQAQEANGGRATGIEEIVVTATKREELLRDIPSSITAFKGDQLQDQAVSSQDDIVRMVPGVVLQSQPADTNRIVIRGVSPAPKGAPNQTTQVMFGDVPFVDNYAPRFVPDPLPFDLQSVEVLKGPQGTLFGSGSLNGIVRYVQNKPEFGKLGASYMGRLTAVGSGDADFLVAGMLNVPAGNNVALRVSGYTGREPGWVDNTTPGNTQKDMNWRDRDAVRVSLGLRPNDHWDITAGYSYEKSLRNGTAVSNNLTGDHTNSNHQVTGFNKYDYSVGSLKVEHHFDGFDLVAVSGLIRTHTSKEEDLTASIIGDLSPSTTGGYKNVAVDTGVNTRVFTQELRLVSTEGHSPWKWVLGANYSHERARGTSLLLNFSDTGVVPSVIGPPFSFGYISFTQDFIRLNWDVKIEEFSGFADVTRKLLDDKVELSVGGRYYRFKTNGVVTNRGTLIELTNFALPGSGLVITNSADQTEDGFNPKASITFRPSDSIMAYASMSRGFRLGGVQSGWSGTGVPPPQYVKSDHLWNYEAGLRTSWLDNRLHIDLAGFHLDWKNAQFTRSDPLAGAFFTDNVGGVKGDGFEASIQLVPVPGLSLAASTAYSDIRTSVPYVSVTQGTVPPGTQWPGSFKWQHAVSLNYSTDVGDVGIKGGVSYASLSGGVADSLFKVGSSNIGYDIVDAHLGFELRKLPSSPELSFAVRNLFNNKGLAANLTDGSIAGISYNYVTYVQPRTFTVTLSGKF